MQNFFFLSRLTKGCGAFLLSFSHLGIFDRGHPKFFFSSYTSSSVYGERGNCFFFFSPYLHVVFGSIKCPSNDALEAACSLAHSHPVSQHSGRLLKFRGIGAYSVIFG
ncbi:hypothetical protein ABW19_dt0200008 [Dactylella cylindrospora]|nr:hypothetical protein ABW19_dt0200008 [Dactylella cylindrospora]